MSRRTRNRDDRTTREPQERRRLRSHVRGVGLVLLLALLPWVLAQWFRGILELSAASEQTGRSGLRPADLRQEERREFRSYVWGIGLALLLTVVPFALVQWFPAVPRLSLLIVIGAFALVQMLVHFRFFLHIGFRQKREDLQLLLFSALLLIIMVAGTIWIMMSLGQRMAMPTMF